MVPDFALFKFPRVLIVLLGANTAILRCGRPSLAGSPTLFVQLVQHASEVLKFGLVIARICVRVKSDETDAEYSSLSIATMRKML